jgi:GxxExxY protein
MKYEEITEKIIGCAYKVFNKLGFGYLESVYQNALILELEKEGWKHLKKIQ